MPLTAAANGIDGAFELWRDSELTDAFVKAHWPGCSYDIDPPNFARPDGGPKMLSSQLILRNADGTILQSRDMEVPQATMQTMVLGDPPTQTIHVSLDTYGCVGRWGGSTHMFARIEHAKTIWYECAESFECALGCRFYSERRDHTDVRDLLVWREDLDFAHDASDPVQVFSRITLTSGGKCSIKKHVVPDWCDDEKGCTHHPTDYPAP